jgi:chromosome segregation ATPase
MIDYRQNIKIALNALKEIEDDSSNLGKELSRLDVAEQDILHIIENLKFNASQGFVLAKKLKEIRESRREIKHRLEQAKEIRAVLDVYKDRLKDRGIKAIEKIDKLEEVKDKRTYAIKTLTELQPYNELSNRQRGLIK